MKIAHIITRLVAGGAQRNTLLCAEYQALQGHQVTVLSGLETGPEGSLLDVARGGPYSFVEIPELVREISPGADLKALRRLRKWLSLSKPDLVHTHTSKAGILGRLAAWSTRSPIIVHTPHGHVFHSYFSNIKSTLFKSIERLMDPLTDATIMLSSGELRDHLAAAVGSPQRMFVIPSGVVLRDFTQPNQTRPSIPTVGYVGRLADIKGPLDLIDAMAILKTQGSDARLLIVGDGPLREAVEERILANSLSESIELTGWQDEPSRFFGQMDLLAVPSHNEGMGRVVVEAMAAGLPVVATAVGGLVDLVLPERTGKLVPARQPQSLADAILQVLSLKDRGRSLGQAGRSRAHEFSDVVMNDRLVRLYSRLALLRGVDSLNTQAPTGA